MKKKFIFFLACWLATMLAYGQNCTPLTPTYNYPFNDFINNDSCWSEATGRLTANSTVSGTTSAWTEDGFGNVGTQDAAKMNIYTSRQEWLITPSIDLSAGPYQLEFDIALTRFGRTNATTFDADDTVAVVISTDNGATWSNANVLRMWTAGQEPSNTGDRIIIDLSAYNSVVKFGFYAASSTSTIDNDLFIDNMVVTALQSCNSPSSLSAIHTTGSTATVTWTENNTTPPAGWIIEYGPTGFALGSGTSVTTATNPTTINALMSSTRYDFYVRSVCAPGDSSSWSATEAFRTGCSAITPTYTYPFNDFINNDSCWSEATGRLTVNSTLSGTTSVWKEDGFGNVGTQDAAKMNLYSSRQEWLITPSIDLSAGPYQLEFDIALTRFGRTNATTFDADDTVAVVISTDNGLTWSNANVLRMWTAGQEPSNTGDRIIIDLSAYNSVVKFGFYAASSTSTIYNDLFIDNMVVTALKSCNSPSSLSAIHTTGSTATVTWTENNTTPPPGWIIEYGPTGFALGSGTSVTTATNPTTINALMSSTRYDFYVRSICAPGDSSSWSATGAFRTGCAAITPTYTYPFNDFINNDSCWSEATGRLTANSTLSGTTSAWIEDGFGNVGTQDAARMNIYSSRQEWLITPSIDLSAGPYQLEFDIALTRYNNTNATTFDADDTVAVVISTDDGVTWSNANVLRMWTAGQEPSNTGDRIIIDLSAYNSVVKFGFYAASSTSAIDNDLFIDSMVVTPLKSCNSPSSLSAIHTTGSTATVTWTENNTTPPLSWIIEYGPTGFALGSGTSVTTATNPTTINALMPTTGYDFYVRSVCAPGDSSSWSYTGTFRTGCTAITPTYTYPFNDFIDNDPCWSEATGRLTANSTLSGTISDWKEDGFGNVGTQNAARMNVYSSRQEWLITPSIDLSAGPYQLEFDIALTRFGRTNATTFDTDDTVAVVISTDDGLTWSNANVLRMWTAGQEPSNTGDHIIIDLSTYSGTVKFGFYAASSTTVIDNDLFIDNFEVKASTTDLVITEIMYNGPEAGADTTEYIEIYNNGTLPVDLTGFSLTGVTFTFPNVTLPVGAYYVVAGNSAAFNSTFGTAPDAVWTTGGLSNGGEAILILDNNGATLDSVRYDDGGVWATSPDGNGPSLILCDVNTNNADGANWAGATAISGTGSAGTYFGSPGSANTCAPTGTDVTAAQFLLNTVNCGTNTLSGGFVIANLSSVDANSVTYSITSNGLPLSTGTLPLLAANSRDTIMVGPIPVATGSGVLQAIVNVSNDTDNSNDTLIQTIYVSNTVATITPVNNVSCNSGNDGSLMAMGSNGIGTYTYTWSNAATTSTINGLTAGNYTVTVTDSVGCTAIDTFDLVDPIALSLTDSITNVDCNGNSTGAISVTIVGGTAPYTYLWSNAATTSTITGLIAGNYDVTVTDNNGCTATGNYTITEPTNALTVSIADNGDATATANATGGTSPYTYLWDDPNSQTTMTANGLTNANNYIVIVTDDNGCTATDTVTIRIINVTTIDGTSNISIFPNPTNDRIFVDLDLSGEQSVQIELYNTVGQRVVTKSLGTVQATRVELSTSNLPTGVYHVHLTVGTEHLTQKLIVRRP